jgi:peroxiredoxin
MTMLVRGFVTLLLVLGCGSPPPPKSEPSSLLGQRLPPFQMETLSGKLLHSSSFEGHPVVLSFVKTDCTACEATLTTAQAVFTDNERTVAWAIFAPDDPAKVKKIAAKLKLEYPVVIDDQDRLKRLFVVSSQPTTVVLDSLGFVRWMGPSIGESELLALVKASEK